MNALTESAVASARNWPAEPVVNNNSTSSPNPNNNYHRRGSFGSHTNATYSSGAPVPARSSATVGTNTSDSALAAGMFADHRRAAAAALAAIQPGAPLARPLPGPARAVLPDEVESAASRRRQQEMLTNLLTVMGAAEHPAAAELAALAERSNAAAAEAEAAVVTAREANNAREGYGARKEFGGHNSNFDNSSGGSYNVRLGLAPHGPGAGGAAGGGGSESARRRLELLEVREMAPPPSVLLHSSQVRLSLQCHTWTTNQ